MTLCNYFFFASFLVSLALCVRSCLWPGTKFKSSCVQYKHTRCCCPKMRGIFQRHTRHYTFTFPSSANVADVIRRAECVRKIADECRSVFAVQSFCNCCRRDPTECSVRADCVDFGTLKSLTRLCSWFVRHETLQRHRRHRTVVTYVAIYRSSCTTRRTCTFVRVITPAVGAAIRRSTSRSCE